MTDTRQEPRTWSVAGPITDHLADAVTMPGRLYTELLRRAQDLNAAGLKGYGLLLGDPTDPHFPYHAVDVVIFDPLRNRRNDPAFQPAFHAQGSYFRQYEDAGFVADPTDLYEAWQAAEVAGLEPVAPFHVHRRQPCNFSSIDFRLHNPMFRWHLIISLRHAGRPATQPFAVTKDWNDFGIDEDDALEGSELAYDGPEVRSLRLALSGSSHSAGVALPLRP